MIEVGAVIDNRISKHRAIALKTSQSNPQRDILEFSILESQYNGPLAEHIHLDQEERTTVIAGVGRYSMNGVEYEAHAGDVVSVLPGTRHKNIWNASKTEPFEYLNTLIPATKAEEYTEELSKLYHADKVDREGKVHPLYQFYILKKTGYLGYPPFIPIAFAKYVLIPIVGTLAGWLGYSTDPLPAPTTKITPESMP
jgi:mannose-6-phosphate isomerase-like protein (cupin superfamily)